MAVGNLCPNSERWKSFSFLRVDFHEKLSEDWVHGIVGALWMDLFHLFDKFY